MPVIRGSAKVIKERGDEENGQSEDREGTEPRSTGTAGDWGEAQTGDNADAFSPGTPFSRKMKS